MGASEDPPSTSFAAVAHKTAESLVAPSSPVTRSQCVYHLLRIPGPTRYSETVVFVVPFCSLALQDPLEEERATILGRATDDDNRQRRPIVGEGSVLIDEEMEQK